jgi:uncharacterized protein YaaN involved in tellurite resistance
MADRKPENAVAEIIVKLESEIDGLTQSIQSSQSWIETNQQTISELEPFAVWGNE